MRETWCVRGGGSTVGRWILMVAAAAALTACSRSEPSIGETRLGARSGSGYGSGTQPGYGARAPYDRIGSPQQLAAEMKAAGLDLVYFSSDSSDLTPEGRDTLLAQIQFLQRHRVGTIMIEGHADERGTREYNIALGARRAETVRSFLAARGIPAASIRTVSYGKERPVMSCNDISCWSQNRRAQTIIAGTAAVAGR